MQTLYECSFDTARNIWLHMHSTINTMHALHDMTNHMFIALQHSFVLLVPAKLGPSLNLLIRNPSILLQFINFMALQMIMYKRQLWMDTMQEKEVPCLMLHDGFTLTPGN